MVDEITLREEIKQWRSDNLHYGNKTPLERRAERILKEVLRNMEKGTEKDLATEEEQEKIIKTDKGEEYKYLFDSKIKLRVPHIQKGEKYFSIVTGKKYKTPKYNFNKIKKELSKQKDILEDGNYEINSVKKYSNQI